MKKIIPVIELAAKLAGINRTTGYREGHFENDAEHSYQLALVCWMANKQYQLGLKDELIFEFALVHDLVEVYSGDIDAHDDKEKIRLKKEIEEKALCQLRLDYPFDEIIQAIEGYEKGEEPEAQLVYILDKFVPDINVYNSKGDYYQARNISKEGWKEWVGRKIGDKKISPKLRVFLDECIKEVEARLWAD